MNNDRMPIDPLTRWNGDMVEQVVQSMRIAHHLNDHCWSLHQVKGSPTTAKLTVGKANVMRWDWDLNHLLIDALSLTEAQASVLAEIKTEKFPKARDLDTPLMMHLPNARLAELLHLFRHAHEEAVRRLVSGPEGQSKDRGIFKAEFGDHIMRISGKTIPEPGYYLGTSAGRYSR